MSDKIKILVSVCNLCWIHKLVVFALLRLQLDQRYHITIILPTHNPYENNLNHVVKDLREVYTDHDFWLNIDADNPPLSNPLDYISHNLDIVGFPTPVWHDKVAGDRPWYFNAVNEKNGGWIPAIGEGLIEVDAVGSGCMLVHRRVCETVIRPLFVREIDEDGCVIRGHDYLFCNKAKRAGFKVWAAFDSPCTHIVENDLLSQIKAFVAAGGA